MDSENSSSVLRTSMILLEPTPQVREYAEQSAVLWNVANYQRRKAFYEHQRMPTYSGQCGELKATEPFKALGTCKAQALLQKLDEAWRSFHALLRLKGKGQ